MPAFSLPGSSKYADSDASPFAGLPVAARSALAAVGVADDAALAFADDAALDAAGLSRIRLFGARRAREAAQRRELARPLAPALARRLAAPRGARDDRAAAALAAGRPTESEEEAPAAATTLLACGSDGYGRLGHGTEDAHRERLEPVRALLATTGDAADEGRGGGGDDADGGARPRLVAVEGGAAHAVALTEVRRNGLRDRDARMSSHLDLWITAPRLTTE